MGEASPARPRIRQTGGMAVTHSWNPVTRGAVLVAGVVGLAALRLPGRPATLCLLRATTGIPCPFCGFTTAGVHLGHADIVGAAASSPLAVATCVGFILAPFIRRSPLAIRWRAMPPRWRQVVPVTAILTVLAASEIWQLIRFGVI
jgi:Protein of unknown function (DUF2752)